MPIVLDNRSDFTLENFQRVAWEEQSVAISDQAFRHMTASRGSFMHYIDDPEVVVYGVTSGYGQNAHLRFTPQERKENASTPPYAPGVSFGSLVPKRVSRGIVFARLTNFVSGYSAISPDLALKVADMLKTTASIPDVPLQGNGGAGEILPLSHLFTDLAASFDLQEKDTLCLINGSPCASA
ncbi:MAG: aromatic amino acid lyase, partial [Rhodospirillales bacterium]|nr:aromatic amino acid lyase [Rhodospirillales bacterium]